MKSCWEDKPEDRPTFSDLVYQLNSVLNPRNTPGYMDMCQQSRNKEDDDRYVKLDYQRRVCVDYDVLKATI